MNRGSAAISLAPVAPNQSRAGLLRGFLAATPDYVSFKDRASRYIGVSHSLIRALGRQRAAEVLGRTDFDFYPAPEAEREFQQEQEILLSGTPVCARVSVHRWPTGRVTQVVKTKLPLRDHTGTIIGTWDYTKDATEARRIESELEQAHKDLLQASRMAGMAEVATGVLHNVGNVLNSLNTSAAVIAAGLHAARPDRLQRLAELLRSQGEKLADFLERDPKGRRVPEYLNSLARHSDEERVRLLEESLALQRYVDHIKEIVAMQQTYAKPGGAVEPLEAVPLMEDALRMCSGMAGARNITLRREYSAVPSVRAEKAKVLQILLNLLRNAQHACEAAPEGVAQITVRVSAAASRVRLSVEDNGIGIAPENLTRIFQHGFTTRKGGHGFGLHSAANAAREMQGTLIVASEGAGRGATFTLELPAAEDTGAP